MSQKVEFVNQSLLRCHLSALIELAGFRLPPSLNQHPDVTKLDATGLLHFVDLYRSYLRGVKK